MRLTKIYTKVGDGGTTLLASGEKVSKASPRIEAYGSIDELNAVVGMLRDAIKSDAKLFSEVFLQAEMRSLLLIQNELFDVGAELATPLQHLNQQRQKVVSNSEVQRLEEEIDVMNDSLPPLENFVLPGGHPINSVAHLARTVCRRSERRIAELAQNNDVRSELKIYINRLSDWFFVKGRSLSAELRVPEVLWQQQRP